MSYYINGSTEIDYPTLQNAPQPIPLSKGHNPVPHIQVVDLVKDKLANLNYQIEEARYGIDQHGDMFGYLKLFKDSEDNGVFKNVLGIRNSHSQRFSAQLAAAGSVMVCDNLSFYASDGNEAKHKHTKRILDVLPGRIDAMLQNVQNNWKAQAKRYDMYQDTELDTAGMHRVIGSAIDNRAVAPSKAIKVINEYKNPRHDEFSPRTAWSMFNAFTEILKETPAQLKERSIKLHTVFDEFVTPLVESIHTETSAQTELAFAN